MAYDLAAFIADCRAALSSDPGPNGRAQVRVALERLLANDDFVRDVCGEKAPRGLKVLYEDPALGFQILAHVNEKPRTSPPHDHGASWAIYGQLPVAVRFPMQFKGDIRALRPLAVLGRLPARYLLLPGVKVPRFGRTASLASLWLWPRFRKM